jgi:hypothetical protein
MLHINIQRSENVRASPPGGELAVTKTPTRPAWRHYLRAMGPGLVTGASDDDPSGIATYSQAGAQLASPSCGPRF